jgi:hypothetical protein
MRRHRAIPDAINNHKRVDSHYEIVAANPVNYSRVAPGLPGGPGYDSEPTGTMKRASHHIRLGQHIERIEIAEQGKVMRQASV